MRFYIDDIGEEKTIRVSLVQEGNRVDIRGKDNKGKTWVIISLLNGRFKRVTNIAPGIGIDVDFEGKIKED